MDGRMSETQGRCVSCRHWASEAPRDERHHNSGYRHCMDVPAGYHELDANEPPDDRLVENDEGWAMLTGPQFGCVKWAPNDDGQS